MEVSGSTVIIVGYRHGDAMSNFVHGCLSFTFALMPVERHEPIHSHSYWYVVGQTGLFNFEIADCLGKEDPVFKRKCG